jgi:SNF2 family DNA or RNA helicase
MGFVAPGLLASKTRFFQKHVETDFWGKITGYKKLGEVTKKIQPFFLRRLKENVLPDLPDKIYEDRIIVLTPKEREIYLKLAEGGHEATEDAAAMVAIIRCKQFCNWPQMVDASCTASSKMDSFREVLDEVVLQNGHKILIFSQYKEMVNVLVGVLDEMGIKYLRIDGDTPTRDRAAYQKKFKDDKSIDAMIGTEAMSTGLTLIADYVCNYDDNWSPSIMSQREDRAHRIGQKNTVVVINMICKDTIEQKIRGVLYAKSKITAQVLGDEIEETVLKRLGPKDIAKLL